MSDLQKWLAAAVAGVAIIGTIITFGHEFLSDRETVDELAAHAERQKVSETRRRTRNWVCRELREAGKIQRGDCPPLPEDEEL